MLNFKNKHRSNGVVFLNFSTGEFSQKPIKYWSNVGIVHKHSTFIKFVKTIKKMCGDNTMNNISRLYYYAGARITFPFHVHWMGDRFELCLYNSFGDGNNSFKISRKVSSQNERFTKDEITDIAKFMETEHHILSGLYNKFKGEFLGLKGQYQVNDKITEINQWK